MGKSCKCRKILKHNVLTPRLCQTIIPKTQEALNPYKTVAKRSIAFKVVATLSRLTTAENPNIPYDFTINKCLIISQLDPMASDTFIFITTATFCGSKISAIIEVEIEIGDSSKITYLGISRRNILIDAWYISQDIVFRRLSSHRNCMPYSSIGKNCIHHDLPIANCKINDISVPRTGDNEIALITWTRKNSQ